MSTLTIDLISSLDGFADAEGWPGYWGLEGPEMFAHFEEDQRQDHVLVMGATTYRVMSEIVEEGDDPSNKRMAEVEKVVFSATLEPPLSWANTRLVATDAVEEIRRMKAVGVPPMRTLGSPSLCRSLLRAGVVDRLRLIIFPVINGATGQNPIYEGWPDVRLEMVRSRTLDDRLQLVEYATTVV